MFGGLWSELQDLFGDLRGPAKALIVVLIGMAFAWMLINHQWAEALWLVLGAIGAGYLLELIGNLFLPKMPRAGLLFLEGWVLGPAAIAAFVSGLIVVVAIDLAPPKDTDPATEELMKTLAAGLSTFLSAAFVSWIGEQDNTRISNRIRDQFYKKYKRAAVYPPPTDGVMYFTPGSRGETTVYSSIQIGGWNFADRWERASKLSAEIATGNSLPKSQAEIDAALRH
ncbi:hypothetical protein [Mesorhizobium sp.]|uniref:hypothetical protein n=1 Tax=Mesorhizobium sp. TaxID=1871066 RepID=UPI003BAC047A